MTAVFGFNSASPHFWTGRLSPHRPEYWILASRTAHCHCVPASWPLESATVVWDVKIWGRRGGGGCPEDTRAEAEFTEEEDDVMWSVGSIRALRPVDREEDAGEWQDVAAGWRGRNQWATFFCNSFWSQNQKPSLALALAWEPCRGQKLVLVSTCRTGSVKLCKYFDKWFLMVHWFESLESVQ